MELKSLIESKQFMYLSSQEAKSMTDRELESFIDAKIKQAIRKHEMIVAILSGTIGFIFIVGLFHAIWLNHTMIQNFS